MKKTWHQIDHEKNSMITETKRQSITFDLKC